MLSAERGAAYRIGDFVGLADLALQNLHEDLLHFVAAGVRHVAIRIVRLVDGHLELGGSEAPVVVAEELEDPVCPERLALSSPLTDESV